MLHNSYRMTHLPSVCTDERWTRHLTALIASQILYSTTRPPCAARRILARALQSRVASRMIRETDKTFHDAPLATHTVLYSTVPTCLGTRGCFTKNRGSRVPRCDAGTRASRVYVAPTRVGCRRKHLSQRMLAICLTGALRWPEFTLASLRQMLLLGLNEPWRAYFVGPADATYFQSAQMLLREHLHVPDESMCAYSPDVSWVWRPPAHGFGVGDANVSFTQHPPDICHHRRRSSPPKLTFNLAVLPYFRRCRDARFGLTELPEGLREHGKDGWRNMDAYDHQRAMPCSGAISLIMQLWQIEQSMELIVAAERGIGGAQTSRHDSVLRVRVDLFFFRPVVLPPLPDRQSPWFSLMERTCDIDAGMREYGRRLRPQFFQDFWMYGNRPAMEVMMREPLRRVVQFGLQQAERSVHFRASSLRTRRSLLRARGDNRTNAEILASIQSSLTKPEEFSVHPLLYGLKFALNSSRCLTYDHAFGLVRVNPSDGCYGVQTRIKYASLSGWTQLNIGNLSAKWHRRQRVVDEFDALVPRSTRDRLPAVAAVYHRCLALQGDQNCPRVVGDKMLRTGAAASCFRHRVDLSQAFKIAPRERRGRGARFYLSPRIALSDECAGAGTLLLADRRAAFACVDAGLASAYRDSSPSPRRLASVTGALAAPAWAPACDAYRMRRLSLRRWQVLQRTMEKRRSNDLTHIRRYANDWHLSTVEALSVTGFVHAILQRSVTEHPALVLDVGSNIGHYTLIAAALGASVVAVDMQPICAHVTTCQLMRNNLSADVINAYVATSDSKPLMVPIVGCNTMASPTAVAGRWPQGVLMKANYLLNDSQKLLVPPVDIASYLLRGHLDRVGSRVAVVKIDVEGFETSVLEALRPIWPRMADVVLELQPTAWKHSNISLDAGLSTLRSLIRANDYTIVTLPHSNPVESVDTSLWTRQPMPPPSPCQLMSRREEDAAQWRAEGWASARVLSLRQLEDRVRAIAHKPHLHGFFHEMWFTPRWRLQQCARAGFKDD